MRKRRKICSELNQRDDITDASGHEAGGILKMYLRDQVIYASFFFFSFLFLKKKKQTG